MADDQGVLATVSVTIGKGDAPGSLRVRQEGTGNVLLRFEALIAAATQLLGSALRETSAKPEGVTDDLVSETLAACVTGKLDPNAETMVSVALDALSPRPAVVADDEWSED